MSEQGTSAETRFEGSVAPAFPLALLEAVRSHDHPGEVLEDEDLTVSLPRRLGLTGVIGTQIQRYEAAQRSGGTVRLDDVVNLIRLVMRRPDAQPILIETGQRVARWHFGRSPEFWQKLLHKVPASFALRSARRSAVKLLKSLHAGSRIEAAKPFTIRVHDCLAAEFAEDGTGSALYTGLLEEILVLHTAKSVHVPQPSTTGTVCEWTAVIA
jgi:hypothetical protein